MKPSEVHRGILSRVPSPKRLGEGDTFHFPEIMLNIIKSSVSDSLAILRQAQDSVCPEYKVVTCRIRKARKTHLRKEGEVLLK